MSAEDGEPETTVSSRIDSLESKLESLISMFREQRQALPEGTPPLSSLVHSSGDEDEYDPCPSPSPELDTDADRMQQLERSRPKVLRSFPMSVALLLHANPYDFVELDTFVRSNFSAVQAEMQRATAKADSSRARQRSTLVSLLHKREIVQSCQNEVWAALHCWAAVLSWVHPELHAEVFAYLCFLSETNNSFASKNPKLLYELDMAIRYNWHAPNTLLLYSDAAVTEVMSPYMYASLTQPQTASTPRLQTRKPTKPAVSPCFKFNSAEGCTNPACKYRHICCSFLLGGGLCGAAHSTVACDAAGATKRPGGGKRK